MQMRVILDAGAPLDAVAKARSPSHADLLQKVAEATKSFADAKSRAVASRLDAAEAHVVAALDELKALADATQRETASANTGIDVLECSVYSISYSISYRPEVHRIADALRESVRLLERRSEATRRGADGALRDGEAALFGFHVSHFS
jgi:DNA repair exonuclease SbcCD ATPase subunit